MHNFSLWKTNTLENNLVRLRTTNKQLIQNFSGKMTYYGQMNIFICQLHHIFKNKIWRKIMNPKLLDMWDFIKHIIKIIIHPFGWEWRKDIQNCVVLCDTCQRLKMWHLSKAEIQNNFLSWSTTHVRHCRTKLGRSISGLHHRYSKIRRKE